MFQTLADRVLNVFWEMNVLQCLFVNVKHLRSVDLVILVLELLWMMSVERNVHRCSEIAPVFEQF